MLDDGEKCTNCDTFTDVYGYCGKNGDPFCELCWNEHVNKCDRCTEECTE